MPTDRFKNERGQSDDKKRDDWRFTGDPKEYAKYKDQVAYDLGKLDTNHLPLIWEYGHGCGVDHAIKMIKEEAPSGGLLFTSEGNTHAEMEESNQ